jgi:hypothetical protein
MKFSGLFLFKDRYGQTADANQFILVVDDADIPDMGTLTQVQGGGRAVYMSCSDAPDMVSVDLQSYAYKFIGIDDTGRTDAAEGLRQRGGSAPMQHPIRLSSAGIDGHPGFQKVFSDLGDFDAEMTRHRIVAKGLQLPGVEALMEPDRHEIRI